MTLLNILSALDLRSVIIAGVMVLVVAFAFVLVLSMAYARLKVEVDPTVEEIEKALPGVNCGGCGFAGCAAYAEAAAKDPSLLGKCGPGGSDLTHILAAILGIEADTSAPMRAIVHCSAHSEDMISSTKYHGVSSCAEAQMIAGVINCPFGCLGLGDCYNACEFDAMKIVDGLATVNYNNCVGCGACAKACPRNIIEMVPMVQDLLLVVGCSSHDKAKDVRGYCTVGCIGCTLCAKQSPETFKMDNDLATIDYKSYGTQEDRERAVNKCPRSLFVNVGKGLSGLQRAKVEKTPAKTEA